MKCITVPESVLREKIRYFAWFYKVEAPKTTEDELADNICKELDEEGYSAQS